MKIIETDISFSSKHPVVDVEVSNDLSRLDWNYEKGEISVAGFLVDNKITQFMRIKQANINKLQISIKDFLSTISKRQLYAFNTNMEIGCLKNLLGESPKFFEIKPFQGYGTTKEYFFDVLVKKRMIKPEDIPKDPLLGQSKLCMDYWKKGRYDDVRKHNSCCLIKESSFLETL